MRRGRPRPHPVHAGPDARRHHRLGRDRGPRRRSRAQIPARTRVRTDPARRRDQPCHAQDAVRPARGHAGTRSHGGGKAPSTPATFLRPRDPEPDRDRRHLSVARSADRSLHAEAGGRGARCDGDRGDHRSHYRPGGAGRDPGHRYRRGRAPQAAGPRRPGANRGQGARGRTGAGHPPGLRGRALERQAVRALRGKPPRCAGPGARRQGGGVA